MRSKTIGRTLGIGLRVAGRVAGERLAAHAQDAGNVQPNQPVQNAGMSQRLAGQSAGRASHGLARGIAGFLRPFGKVGRALWLEVIGVFFLLPVLVFGRAMWTIRSSWAQGPDHRAFLVSGGIVVVFLYLSVTSFWRARRK